MSYSVRHTDILEGDNVSPVRNFPLIANHISCGKRKPYFSFFISFWVKHYCTFTLKYVLYFPVAQSTPLVLLNIALVLVGLSEMLSWTGCSLSLY